MWRAILLGKLGISISATLIVGGLCASRPWRVEMPMLESAQWIGIGAFFILLAVLQVAVIFFLKPPSKGSAKRASKRQK